MIALKTPIWIQQAITWAAALRINSWWLSFALPRLDRLALQITKNRSTLTGSILDLPVVTLTTTGVKSGLQRSTPLFGIYDGDKVMLIATSFGSKRHPAWYYNLRAHPEAILLVEGRTRQYRARHAEEHERQQYWRQACEMYRGYESYREWASGREIPIMVLEPLD
jgi:deazaflavin-dependent oxidoreductase (nitroreductase family)